MSATPEHLFVYGTLQPGDVRWPILAEFVVGDGAVDAADGTLFDTGCDYPAAVFDAHRSSDAAVIAGRAYLLDPDRIGEALSVLDSEESSVPGGYHRVEVITKGGLRAWAYQYGSGLDLTPIPGGDWLAWRAPGAARQPPA